MAEPTGDFLELLQRARQGDEVALASLVALYETEVRIVARALLGPSLRPLIDSDDLIQSIHRTLILGLKQQRFAFESPEQLRGLAVTMLRRKIARQWRRRKRQQDLGKAAADLTELTQVLILYCRPA